MIKRLEYTTKDGNRMALGSAPLTLGIELLFISCTEDEKAEVLADLMKLEEQSDVQAALKRGEL